ncbi:ParB family chromosome partitioning protein [Azospirillum sp. OGB3]|uniref:ParB/RepB/Spo0J family partition protein n=1 Tax=Azospirillum sp. OGB3 TaxID=2587012 RepID=UPI00160673F7|nr:ParB/RepB/Spo0J family partition protein [Azospirillum sp. OGB3]MBB3268381.1 ParB family chromosome partitioning protein [Azospirillum sp. OGB3]
MSPRKGKGLSPILGAASSMIGDAASSLVTDGTGFRHSFEVPVSAVKPDPNQPRKTFHPDSIAELATTMAEQGQLSPILVQRDPDARGRWIIVAGERRWRAAQHNGWTTILASESPGDAAVVSLIENLQRVDLSPVEEARGVKRLMDDMSWSQKQAAEKLGKRTSEISAVLRILSLPESLLDKVLTSELSIAKNVLVELARVEDDALRQRLIGLAWSGGLTVKAIRSALQPGGEGQGREEEPSDDGVPSDRGASEAVAARSFNFKSLDRLVRGLRQSRESGRRLEDEDRDRLRRLRQEIDDILGGP